MFNRLPIYSRPKEPAIGSTIGRPVLTSSTNSGLVNPSLRQRSQTVDLDGRPRNPSPALGPSSGNIGFQDPNDYLPATSIAKALEDEPQRPSKRVPPRRPPRPDEPRPITPHETAPRAESPAYAPPIGNREREERSRAPSPNAGFPHTLRTATPPVKKFNVMRKPAPAPDPVFDGTRGGLTGTTITAITAGNPHSKSGGFANLREKVVGRRRPSNARLSPTSDSDSDYERVDDFYGNGKVVEIPPEEGVPKYVKPPNLVSIDDWLTDREGLHKRSNTASTVATRRSRAPGKQEEGDKRAPPPGEFLPVPEPTMPLIPAHFLPRSSSSSPAPMYAAAPRSMAQVEAPPPSASTKFTVRQESLAHHHKNVHSIRRDDPQPARHRAQHALPPRKDSVPAQLRQQEPSPAPPAPEPAKPEQPKDRVQRLEEEQESLEKRKRDLKKEIHNLEQLLPPNITTHPRGTKEELMEQLEILNRAVADVDKDLYEVGMRLHRAYRRYEKTHGTEGPTHLWISRVMARKEGVE